MHNVYSMMLGANFTVAKVKLSQSNEYASLLTLRCKMKFTMFPLNNSNRIYSRALFCISERDGVKVLI